MKTKMNQTEFEQASVGSINIEAEQAVLGSIIIDQTCLPEVMSVLRAEDFGLEMHRAMFRAAVSLHTMGQAVDPITVGEKTRAAGVEVQNKYLLQLMDTTPTAANVMEYVPIVRQNALRRGVAELANSIQTRANEGEEPHALLGELIDRGNALAQEGSNKVLLDPTELALRWYDHRERVESGKSAAFVPTGYRDLDMILGGGLIASGMHVLAARPGMGKTTFALNIADRAAASGPVLFVSLEMDDEQIYSKRLARECGIAGSKLLLQADLTDEEQEKMAKAADKLVALPLHVNARPSATVAEIAAMARQVRGLRLIVIDYMGKIARSKEASRDSLYEAVTRNSADVKTLARTFKVPVLVLCQINRESEKRSDKRPNLADLRDTGAIEQDADTVIFLYRKDYYGNAAHRDPTMPDDTECIVAKNRHAGTGSCQLAFYPAASKFVTAASDPRSGYRQAVRTGSE